MKTFSALALFFCLAFSVLAEPNAYVPKSDDMRIVDGKMYNRVLSTNWVTLPIEGATLTVVEVLPEGVVFQSAGKTGADGKILVKHVPGQKSMLKGKTMITSVRALPVNGVKYGNDTVAAYDCGVANTDANRKALKKNDIEPAKPQ